MDQKSLIVTIIKWLYLEVQTKVLSEIVKFAFTWEEKGNCPLVKVIKLFFSLANTVSLGHTSVSSRFLRQLHLTLG